MKMSLYSVYHHHHHPAGFVGLGYKKRANSSRALANRFSEAALLQQVSSVLVQTDGGGKERTGIDFGSGKALLIGQPKNTVGVIGGASAFSTLVFLEKLVRWGGKYCPPFVVCSDSSSTKARPGFGSFVEGLKRKRAFLEESGASCMVMPCHLSHLWHDEISGDSSLPFLHVGECVARELFEANLKPLEVGSDVKIGVLATNEALVDGIYQGKLERQGFEVVLPDKATMEHIVVPSAEALRSGDVEGARNLLRIAVQILMMRGTNTVVVAADEMRGLLSHDDPLLNKCTDPMDALARSVINWAKSKENVKI